VRVTGNQRRRRLSAQPQAVHLVSVLTGHREITDYHVQMIVRQRFERFARRCDSRSDDWFIVTVEGSQLGDRTGYVEAKFLAPVSVKPSIAPTATAAPAAAPVGMATSNSTPTATAPSARVTASSSTPTAPSASVPVSKDPQTPTHVPTTSPANTSPIAPSRVRADASRPYTNDQLGRNIQIGAKGKGRIQGALLVEAAVHFFIICDHRLALDLEIKESSVAEWRKQTTTATSRSESE
jgi:hypothetical protein